MPSSNADEIYRLTLIARPDGDKGNKMQRKEAKRTVVGPTNFLALPSSIVKIIGVWVDPSYVFLAAMAWQYMGRPGEGASRSG